MHALLTMPSPPLQQKVQKNFRLTQVCVNMLQDLGRAWGVPESSVIERLTREAHEHYGLTRKGTTK
jgi:hypothetical protein